MHPLICSHQAEHAELCRRFHVRRLDVFGSATGDKFNPTRSDLDFLVDFEPGAPLRALDRYFGLKEALEALLGRPVDLVISAAVINPCFRAGIEQTREMVYAA